MSTYVLVRLLHGCCTRFGSQTQAFAIEALYDVRKAAYDFRSLTLETSTFLQCYGRGCIARVSRETAHSLTVIV